MTIGSEWDIIGGVILSAFLASFLAGFSARIGLVVFTNLGVVVLAAILFVLYAYVRQKIRK